MYAKVLAVNVKGDSVASSRGNGGVIQRIPDAPLNLANLPLVTLADRIGLEWTDGPENGGTNVLDYRVLSNGGSGDVFTAIESNIL
jgi:hypothetical protein